MKRLSDAEMLERLGAVDALVATATIVLDDLGAGVTRTSEGAEHLRNMLYRETQAASTARYEMECELGKRMEESPDA